MVSCQELPPLEDDFRLVIKPPDHYHLDLVGRVVWTTICNPVSGAESIGVDVQFVSIQEKDRSYLQGLIINGDGEGSDNLAKKHIARTGDQTEIPLEPAHTPHIADIRLPVFYNKDGKTIRAVGSRFSTRGCHLYTKLAPPKGSVFSLKVENPRTGKYVHVDSSVVQCKRCAFKNHWGMVLRFMNLSGSERNEIRRILEEASDVTGEDKGPRYIKSKIGQALLKHFGKKRTVH
jgi:hypothetical protein